MKAKREWLQRVDLPVEIVEVVKRRISPVVNHFYYQRGQDTIEQLALNAYTQGMNDCVMLFEAGRLKPEMFHVEHSGYNPDFQI